MNTEEHLTRIIAKCRELLATAEKRTPGKWQTIGKHIVKESDDDVIASSHGDFMPREMDNRNATFIASCAGPAEAGWRATIAAIEGLQAAERLIYFVQNDYDESPSRRWIEEREKVISAQQQIIAAWPEELLS